MWPSLVRYASLEWGLIRQEKICDMCNMLGNLLAKPINVWFLYPHTTWLFGGKTEELSLP